MDILGRIYKFLHIDDIWKTAEQGARPRPTPQEVAMPPSPIFQRQPTLRLKVSGKPTPQATPQRAPLRVRLGGKPVPQVAPKPEELAIMPGEVRQALGLPEPKMTTAPKPFAEGIKVVQREAADIAKTLTAPAQQAAQAARQFGTAYTRSLAMAYLRLDANDWETPEDKNTEINYISKILQWSFEKEGFSPDDAKQRADAMLQPYREFLSRDETNAAIDALTDQYVAQGLDRNVAYLQAYRDVMRQGAAMPLIDKVMIWGRAATQNVRSLFDYYRRKNLANAEQIYWAQFGLPTGEISIERPSAGELLAAAAEPLRDIAAPTGMPGTVGAALRPLVPLDVIPTYLASRWRGENVSIGELARKLADPQEPLDNIPMLSTEAYHHAYNATGSVALGLLAGAAGLAADAMLDLSSIAGGFFRKTTTISAQMLKNVRWHEVLGLAARDGLIEYKDRGRLLKVVRAFGDEIREKNLVVDLAAGASDARRRLTDDLTHLLRQYGVNEFDAYVLGRALIDQAAADLQPGWRIRGLPWPLPAKEVQIAANSIPKQARLAKPDVLARITHELGLADDKAAKKVEQAFNEVWNEIPLIKLVYGDDTPDIFASKLKQALAKRGIDIGDWRPIADVFMEEQQRLRIAPTAASFANLAANTELVASMHRRVVERTQPMPQIPEDVIQSVIANVPQRFRESSDFYTKAAAYVVGETPMPAWPVRTLPLTIVQSTEATRYINAAKQSTAAVLSTLRSAYSEIIEELRRVTGLKKTSELAERFPFIDDLRFALHGQGPRNSDVERLLSETQSVLSWTTAKRQVELAIENNRSLYGLLADFAGLMPDEARSMELYLDRQHERLLRIIDYINDVLKRMVSGEKVSAFAITEQTRDALRFHARLEALNRLRQALPEAYNAPEFRNAQRPILTAMEAVNKFWESLADFENPLIYHLDMTGEIMLLARNRRYPAETRALVAQNLATRFNNFAEAYRAAADGFEKTLQELGRSGLNATVYEAMTRNMLQSLYEREDLPSLIKAAVNNFRPYYHMLPEPQRNSFIWTLERAEKYHNDILTAADSIFRRYRNLNDIDFMHTFLYVNLRQSQVGRGEWTEGVEIAGRPLVALQYLLDTYLPDLKLRAEAFKRGGGGQIDWNALMRAIPKEHLPTFERIRDISRLGEEIINFHKDIWQGGPLLRERGFPAYADVYNALREMRGQEATPGLGEFYMHASYFAPPEMWQRLANALGHIPAEMRLTTPFRVYTRPAEYTSAVDALLDKTLQSLKIIGQIPGPPLKNDDMISNLYPLLNVKAVMQAYSDDIFVNIRSYEVMRWIKRWFPQYSDLRPQELTALTKAGWAPPAAIADIIPEASQYIVSPEANLALANMRAGIERFYYSRNAILNNAGVRAFRVWPLMSPMFQWMQVTENFLYNVALASRYIRLTGFRRGVIYANKVLAKMLARPFDAEYVSLDLALRKILGSNWERLANTAAWTDAHIGGLFEWLWQTMTRAVRGDIRRMFRGYADIAKRQRREIEEMSEYIYRMMHRYPVIESSAPYWARMELKPLREVMLREGMERAREFAKRVGFTGNNAKRFADLLNRMWFGFDTIGRSLLYASLIASGETPETARNILTRFSVEYSPHMYSALESWLQGIMWYLRYPYHRLQQLPLQMQENPQMMAALLKVGRVSLGGNNLWSGAADRMAMQLYSEEPNYEYTVPQIDMLLNNLPYPSKVMTNFVLLPPTAIDLRDFPKLREYLRLQTGFPDILFFVRVPFPIYETLADIAGVSHLATGEFRGVKQVVGGRLIPPLRALTGDIPPPEDEPIFIKILRFLPMPTWARLLAERAAGRERMPFRFETEKTEELQKQLAERKVFLGELQDATRKRLEAMPQMQELAQRINDMRIKGASIYALPMGKAFLEMPIDEKIRFIDHTLDMQAEGEVAGYVDCGRAIRYAANAMTLEEKRQLRQALMERMAQGKYMGSVRKDIIYSLPR